jgi:hypothetical protein
MFIVIRQHNVPLASFPVRRNTRKLSAHHVARAVQLAELTAKVSTGYYDVVLTPRPDDPRYDLDSTIEIA